MDKNEQTKTETAVLTLKKAITRGELSAGMRLIPAKLEKQLNLSSLLIREAIRELVGSGLVEFTKHKGAYIAEPLELSEIGQIYTIRYQLEGEAAFLGTQNISETDIIRMELILEKLAKIELLLPDGFFLNQDFHMILYRASGWKYLIKVIERMIDQVMAFRSSLYKRSGEQRFAFAFDDAFHNHYLEEHNKIVKLVKERNPRAVRQAVVDHLRILGLENIQQIFRQVVKKESEG